MNVCIATTADALGVQQVLNHKANIEWLGGFTPLSSVYARIHSRLGPSVWCVKDDSIVVAVLLSGGRTQPHIWSIAQVAVLPEYQHHGCSRLLHYACVAQGVLESRRLFETRVMCTNEEQKKSLPHLGFTLAAELKHYTRSARTLLLYHLDLLSEGSFDCLCSEKATFVNTPVEVVLSSYQEHVWKQGFAAAKKFQHATMMNKHHRFVLSDPRIRFNKQWPLTVKSSHPSLFKVL